MTVCRIDVRDLDDTELGAEIRAALSRHVVILISDGTHHANVRREDDAPLPKDDP